MLKRIIVSILALSFMINAFAVVPSNLSSAVDELHYALTVEWDQEDEKFYNDQIEKFQSELSAMNLTNEEILEYVKTEIKDKDIIAAFDIISKSKMSKEEAVNFMKTTVEKSYARGANWVHPDVLPVVGGLVVVGLVYIWLMNSEMPAMG